MKEVLIFILIFLAVFIVALVIFSGRFIYAQLKYNILGPAPLGEKILIGIEGPEKIVIPLIGIEAPVILAENSDEYTLQKALEKGVVLYPNSNIILGHSSAYPWYRGNYGSVFSLLNKLEKGDEILLFSEDKEYNYQVVSKEIKAPKEISTESDKPNLYLISCWPINTDWKRIVVKADLTKIK